MSYKIIRTLCMVALTACLALGAAGQQAYNYFPGGAATDDGRTVALAGENIATLAQDSLTFILAVPAGESQFELGIFDGETGLTDGNGQRHWDNGGTQLQYALFYDPFQQGSTDPGNLVGVWRGNQSNPTVDPGGTWSASSATFPDDDWWNLTVDVPVPPSPQPGQAPSGATYYHLCISYGADTGDNLNDPCTGDPRPADSQPQTISNFKIRATANISVLSFAFAYEGALRPANADLNVIYPAWDGLVPAVGSTFWLTTPTTYDGTWSFNLDVPVSVDSLRLFDGDFDFGTATLQTFPSQLALVPCSDTDDADTPNDALFPPFAVGPSGVRRDDSLPEGARSSGSPADNSISDILRREPCVHYTLTSPEAVYQNSNPSSQREWEQFRISSLASCDASPTCDPTTSDCADHCEADTLPAGTWRVEIEGVDLFNLNAWRSDSVVSFCLNCELLPRPYMLGDTVFEDLNGNGEQDPGEPGIPGVLVELVDGNGQVLRTVLTGDPGSYPTPGAYAACRERNTGTGTPIDEAGLYCFDVAVPNADPLALDSTTYTVRIADSNFQPGGALFDYFGVVPDATRTSPAQTDTVHEQGDNVMTYDFGYRAELGSLGDRVWLDLDADGVQDPGEPGINGVTVQLFDGDGNLVATQVTAGDGEYLFEDLPPGTYTVLVDAATLPADLAQTYDLDGLATLNSATAGLASGEDRRDVDFGYAPCLECDGKVSRLDMVYLGDGGVSVRVEGRRGPVKDAPLFDAFVAHGEVFSVVGPSTGNDGLAGTLGTEITVFVDGVANTTIHTSCSQEIGPGMIFGDFLIVYAESKNNGPMCPAEGDDGGGDGGGDDGTMEGTGTIGYWKNHPEAWPVDEIELGGGIYSQEDALALLNAPVRGDMAVSLAQQLIAAKLNVGIGNDASCIADTIAAADAYLAANPPGSKPKGGAKQDGEALKDVLDAYNNGELCAPNRG